MSDTPNIPSPPNIQKNVLLKSGESNIMGSINPLIRYFVPPDDTLYMQWGQTIMVLLFLVVLFISIILIYIYSNLNEYQNPTKSGRQQLH